MDNVNFGLNQYCGPAVLSIFTGLDTDTCAEAISQINGRHKITGVNVLDLTEAGELLGIEIKENSAFQGRSLFWTASALTHFRQSLWLVTIPRHYIAIEVAEDGSIQICDNHTKEPMDLQNSARLSQRVEGVYKVTKVREYVVPKLTKISFHAYITGSRIMLDRIHSFSDGKDKVYPMGSFECPLDRTKIQEIAFELMKLSEVKE